MKTNGDVVREILGKMSDEKIYQNCKCTDLEKILCKKIKPKRCGDDVISCHKCYIDFLSQPYEEPKRWYLHRYSTKVGKELYFDGFPYNENVNPKLSIKYTFEEACKMRTKLNKERENKKNLWLLGEMKYEK